jgi:PAS domain S-box-containing protein
MASNEVAQTLSRFTDGGPLKPVIVQSWQRSGAAGVDRESSPVFRQVPLEDLTRRQGVNRLLVDTATPHLRWLSEWFHDRPHVAYLVDADGIVLKSEGDQNAIAMYRLSPGYDWSEAAMGTNGAGTALASGTPVAVVGCDHWSTAWKDATCLGAPILGLDGRPLGAIDISMDLRDGDAERLVVVAHVAYTISQELARQAAEVRSRETEHLYAATHAALEAERQARAEAETAFARARAAEAERSEVGMRLQTIIDSTPAVVYVVDAAATFHLINRHFAELFAIDAAAVVGRSLFEYFPADIADQFVANNRQVLETGTTCEFEEVIRRGTEVRTYLSVKAPLCDANGTPYAVCGVSTDISERKRLTAALEMSQRHKDAFIATVAHELRQPLGAIQAALGVMRTRTGRDQGERARKVIERQVDQLARMVEDLLDAARIAQGKVTLRRAPTALNEIIESVVQVVQPSVQELQQQLVVDVPADAVWLDADAARLQQVFSNLLTNAVKFTSSGGRIDVRVETLDSRVIVRIRDNGAGISAEVLPHIFELFAQGSSDGRGLGIGLAVVRVLVEQHGGTVSASSAGSGQGSEFVISLPTLDLLSA